MRWVVGVPANEGGRVVLVRRSPDGAVADVVPEGVNVRTRVHEYGGGAWWLAGDTAWFTDFADQRLYRLVLGADPIAVTDEPAESGGERFADGRPGPQPDAVTCVRERYGPDGQVDNAIVTVGPDGQVSVLVSGPDFVSDPRWSAFTPGDARSRRPADRSDRSLC